MLKYLLLIIMLCNTIAFSQTFLIFIELTDGTSRKFDISEIKELGFSGNTTNVLEELKIRDICKNFVLHQNFPNPFNPDTRITYRIPETGFIEIRIFDIQGKLVSSLDNSIQQEGEHSILWNGLDDHGSSVGSGTYICRVSFKDNFLTSKLLLIK